VGEYIECGKVKGTVEGFTLRSIRLRHQDGQLHTVPFGQLGEITNFSRDWTTVKFNLVLDRDVDLEQVRKIAKRIGLTLKDDPRFSEQTLDPLKLQGIVDVSESTVTVRFRFNAKPDNTVELERAAKVELLKAFRTEGMLAARLAPQSYIVQAPSRAPRKPAAPRAKKPASAKA
jgi:small-conductance mechanosensitive channel